jgi:hypothetical protein
MSFRVLLILVMFFVFAPVFLVSASTSNGTIDAGYIYAWSSDGGWVNFGTENGNVHITDAGLTGYIWSEVFGWINLNPTTGGVLNDGEGNLSGNAWGENTGWIDFSDVAINSSGEFTGTATNSVLGTVTFSCLNCGVKTDWRPVSSRVAPAAPPPSAYCGDNSCDNSETCTTCPADCGECPAPAVGGSGNSENSVIEPPANPFDGLGLLINNGAGSTNSAEITIQISAGSASKVSTVDISNFADFQDFSNKPYQANIPWILTLGDGTKTVYVKLHNAQNQISNVLTSNIELSTRLPDIEVSGESEGIFNSNQDVVISGKTDPESTVVISFDDKYAQVKADESGKYSADIGKIKEGAHPAEVISTNKQGNSRSVEVNLVVEKPGNNVQNAGGAPQEEKTSIFNNIKETIQSFFNIKPLEIIGPTIIIPKKIPAALTGKWTLFHVVPPNINK